MNRSHPVGQAGKLTDELALRAATILAKGYKQHCDRDGHASARLHRTKLLPSSCKTWLMKRSKFIPKTKKACSFAPCTSETVLPLSPCF